MNITESKNECFHVQHVKMNCDNELHNNFAEPFNSFKSGFCLNINGYSGSGKTNLLVNLFTMRNKNKKKCSFKGCFHRIFFVSPSMHTIKNSIFDDIPSNYKFSNLNDFLMNYENILDESYEGQDESKHKPFEGDKDKDKEKPPLETCVIFDDVGSEIRLNNNEKLFNALIANRRHHHISVINLTQRMMQIPPSVRSNLSHLVSFKPKSVQEEEIIYEFTKLPKKHLREFFKHVYREKFDFLLIDMSLNSSNDFVLYKKFNRLDINIS